MFKQTNKQKNKNLNPVAPSPTDLDFLRDGSRARFPQWVSLQRSHCFLFIELWNAPTSCMESTRRC